MISSNDIEDSERNKLQYPDLLADVGLIYLNRQSQPLAPNYRSLVVKSVSMIKQTFVIVSVFFNNLQFIWEVDIYVPSV